MTIKTQQRTLLVIIGIIFVVMFGIVAQSNRVSVEYQAINLVMTGIIRAVSDINLVSSDYQIYHDDRPLTQIERRLAALSRSLDSLPTTLQEYRAINAGMRQELKQAQQVFDRLKAAHYKLNKLYNGESPESADPFVLQEIVDLSRNLSISSLALSTSAHGLLKSLASKQEIEISFYAHLVLGGLAVSFAVLALSVFIFSRRLVSSMGNLKSGAARIANGDFTSRVKLTGNDELTDLAGSINAMSEKLRQSYETLEDEIEERKRTEESLLESEQQLREREERVKQLNGQLENQLVKLQEANREMESFTYSVSHDLRAPLRHVSGFVELLLETDTSGLDDTGKHYLKVIADSAKKMSCLIDDLLSFSRMGRGEMIENSVNLQQLTSDVIEEISRDLPSGRQVEWHTGELPVVTGDRAMLRLVLFNLISNAVKYSAKVDKPSVEIGTVASDDCHTLFVKDNGAGFNMKYVDKLFGLFQRLHSSEEYEGTGVGLANVRRIIGRHGGKTWADGELNKGATFYFTLPYGKEINHE